MFRECVMLKKFLMGACFCAYFGMVVGSEKKSRRVHFALEDAIVFAKHEPISDDPMLRISFHNLDRRAQGIIQDLNANDLTQMDVKLLAMRVHLLMDSFERLSGRCEAYITDFRLQ